MSLIYLQYSCWKRFLLLNPLEFAYVASHGLVSFPVVQPLLLHRALQGFRYPQVPFAFLDMSVWDESLTASPKVDVSQPRRCSAVSLSLSSSGRLDQVVSMWVIMPFQYLCFHIGTCCVGRTFFYGLSLLLINTASWSVFLEKLYILWWGSRCWLRRGPVCSHLWLVPWQSGWELQHRACQGMPHDFLCVWCCSWCSQCPGTSQYQAGWNFPLAIYMGLSGFSDIKQSPSWVEDHLFLRHSGGKMHQQRVIWHRWLRSWPIPCQCLPVLGLCIVYFVVWQYPPVPINHKWHSVFADFRHGTIVHMSHNILLFGPN